MVVQNVGETQQYGCADVAQGQFVHHLAQVDLDAVLLGGDHDVPLLVDTEIRDAPAVDVVEVGRILNMPFFHFSPRVSYGC